MSFDSCFQDWVLQELRAEALANKFRNESIKEFWGETNSIRRSSERLSHTVEGLSTEEDIVKMWRNHFAAKLNCLNDFVDARLFPEQMGSCTLGTFEEVSTSEIKSIVRNIPNDKVIGIDEIPNDFYKKAPKYL